MNDELYMSVYHTAHAAHVKKKRQKRKKLVAGQFWEQAATSEQGPGLGSGFRLQSLNLSSRFPKQTQQGQGCGIDRVIWRNSLSVLSLSLTVQTVQVR